VGLKQAIPVNYTNGPDVKVSIPRLPKTQRFSLKPEKKEVFVISI